jgi:hypothetical protein
MNDVTVEYCPTGNMVVGFFAKPLQGSLFCCLQDFILNVDSFLPNHMGDRSVLE